MTLRHTMPSLLNAAPASMVKMLTIALIIISKSYARYTKFGMEEYAFDKTVNVNNINNKHSEELLTYDNINNKYENLNYNEDIERRIQELEGTIINGFLQVNRAIQILSNQTIELKLETEDGAEHLRREFGQLEDSIIGVLMTLLNPSD
ncbi:unnamed protein product [Meganyctiphanes norvegica]|uniref:Uncharacterized protein n=1 Tax=Meganyctiphanes norvegica TaxID=48144 RepID=A0AAV2PJA0_MEGNR